MSPETLAIISVVVLAVGVLATAGFGFYLLRAWRELGRRSGLVKQQHQAIDAKTQAFRELIDLKTTELGKLLEVVSYFIGDYRAYNWDHHVDALELTPEEIGLIEFWYTDEQPTSNWSKESLLFSLSLNQLDGYCSIRRLMALVKPYNEQARAAKEPELAFTEPFIRDTLKRHEFDFEHGGPVMTFEDNKRFHEMKAAGMWVEGMDYKMFDNYVLLWTSHLGGKTRRLVPLQEIFSKPVHLQSVIHLPARMGAVDDPLECGKAIPDCGTATQNPNGPLLLSAEN